MLVANRPLDRMPPTRRDLMIAGIPYCPKCGHEVAMHRQSERDDGPVCSGVVRNSGRRGTRPCACVLLGGGGEYDTRLHRTASAKLGDKL